ncbi:TPA: tyrosine-type recombinase/integrase, partial [Mannheimia haemolytica]|nr:tyrosine-type recombinase/integrase [Mannheimia haemolytica]HDL1139774.1 tyrosine-type recombinase/integrase [Mannheimia haemolytica]HDL1154843.1 tyrosine-type recombinase/integrase [Mannheimia haemolytica]HDL1157391.1 tyrosine-type recombinase/integrase [Mannheimia haemolytica]HDL1162398.1 tyrosine-type recombinase/integrase [Mannheimia haemolytica]
LRHSHVAYLIEQGFSPVVIAERLGHESISITLNYAHLYLGRDKTEKKESVIGAIKKHKRKIDKTIEQSHSMSNDMEL